MRDIIATTVCRHARNTTNLVFLAHYLIPSVLDIWTVGWAKKVSSKFLSISSPNIDRFLIFTDILWKICNKVITKYRYTLAAALHYLVKYNFSKIYMISINAYAKLFPTVIFLFKLDYV